ncbi:MAG: DnaJ domain-containing protein [Gammaproteobacteria bacterium]
MIRILFLLGLIFLVSVLLQWFIHSRPAVIKKVLTRVLLTFAVLVLFYLTVTGRLGWLLPIIGGLVALLARSLPHLLRFAPLLQRLWMQYRANRQQTAQDKVSTVETEFVRMSLDHDRGEIHGEVLKGRFAGRSFSELDLQSLLQLREEVLGHDADSVALIESYLDRIYPNDWRTAGSSRKDHARSNEDPGMSREEALEVLGLAPNASRNEVLAAHRRLIQKIHPDRGGSGYLAAKINRAREVLLG